MRTKLALIAVIMVTSLSHVVSHAQSLLELAKEQAEQNYALQALAMIAIARVNDHQLTPFEQKRICAKIKKATQKTCETPEGLEILSQASESRLTTSQLADLVQSPFQAAEVYAVSVAIHAKSSTPNGQRYLARLFKELEQRELLSAEQAAALYESF